MKRTINREEEIMKRTIIAAAFIITALSVTIFGQTSDKKSDENDQAKKEVIALAKEYANALVKRDSAALERILSDDYGDISTEGVLTTKAIMVRMPEEFMPNAPRLEAVNFDELFTYVRVYDKTAVLVTKINLKWQGSKEKLAKKWKSTLPMSDAYVVTLVAVKKNGTWQIVSTHESEYLVKTQATPTKD